MGTYEPIDVARGAAGMGPQAIPAAEIMPAALAGAGGALPGAEVGAMTLNIEQPMMDAAEWYEVWMGRVSVEERKEILKRIMVEEGVSEEWLKRFDQTGKKLLRGGRSNAMRLTRGLSQAQKAAYTLNWDLAQRFRGKGGIPVATHDAYAKKILSLLRKTPGVPKEYLASLGKLTPEALRKAGPLQALSTLETARPNTAVGSIWRWFLQGREIGKPPERLAKETRDVLGQLLGEAPEVAETGAPAPAKTKVGRAMQKVGELGKKATRRVSAGQGLPPSSPAAVGALRGAGVKGMGRAAMGLAKMGGLGPLVGMAALAHTAHGAMTEGHYKARDMYEAWSKGQGMANPSESLLRDFLNKKDNISRRRAMLQKDPEMLQKVVQAIAESGPQSPYTASEIPLGQVAQGPGRGQGRGNTEDLDAILGAFLSQLGEV